jgi:hypothetical protein
MIFFQKLIASFSKSIDDGRVKEAQDIINTMKTVKSQKDRIGEISDGYHTFNELYEYRLLYNAALFNEFQKQNVHNVHKSKRHYAGDECFGGGWFIVMAWLPTGQISNHYEMKYWDLFNIPERDKADQWDGHSPEVAKQRLTSFILSGDKS